MSGTRALTAAEVKRLLSVARNDRHGLRNVAIVLVGLSGLRAGEIAQIENKQLIDNGEPVETFNLRRDQTKTKSTRSVFLSGQAVEACRLYLAEKKFLHGDNAFFESQKGSFSRGTMVKLLNSLLIRAGIPNATSHTLRKTCATMVFEKTGNVLFVKNLLGHSSTEHTVRYCMNTTHNTAEFMAKVKW